MIGNDIIDWQSAKNQTQKLRIRCLEKLFNPQEIKYILNQDNPLFAFWKLWSAKESAYKAWQRESNSIPIFNPITFCSENIKDSSICIAKGKKVFHINVETTNHYIYTYSADISKSSIVLQTKEAYLCYMRKLKNKGWQIFKDKNAVPSLVNTGKNQSKPISISHDQKWYAILY